MERPAPPQQQQSHRDACDMCHSRKVRCLASSGACTNCIAAGVTCTYSPKIPAGRPRKKRPGNSKSSSSESASSHAKNSAKESKRRSSRSPVLEPLPVVENTAPTSTTPGDGDVCTVPLYSAKSSPFKFGQIESLESHHGLLSPPPTVDINGNVPSVADLLDTSVLNDPCDAFDFNNMDTDMYIWTAEHNLDTLMGGSSMGDSSSYVPSLVDSCPASAPAIVNSSSCAGMWPTMPVPGDLGPRALSEGRPPLIRGEASISATPTAVTHSSYNTLMDLSLELRTLRANCGNMQADSSHDDWIREDSSVFASSNSLCDLVDQMINDLQTFGSSVSQAQIGLWLAYEASNSIVDTLEYTVERAQLKHFEEAKPRRSSTPHHVPGNPREEPSLKLTLSSARRLSESQTSVADVLAARRGASMHLTTSSFQTVRLLLMLERIVEVVEGSEESASALMQIPIADMRNNCTRIKSIMSKMQAMSDALLNAPMRYL